MKKSTFKKWQLISWEPEIFISGGLILSLIHIQPFLNQIKFVLAPFQLPGLSAFLVVLSSALGGLTVGFIFHLILRALWLMKMGIATNFKKPLDVKSFGYQPIYEKRLYNINIHKSALFLGRLSSLIFSITFFFLLISIGFSVLATVLIGLSIYFVDSIYALPIIIGLFALLLFDFITLGYLKSTKVGRFLYPLFFILYTFSLSFIYKDVYYNLIRNLKKGTIIIGFILFLTLSLGLGFVNVSEALMWNIPLKDTRYENYFPNQYDDEREAYSRTKARISSYYQPNNVIRLFLLGYYHAIENALDNNTLIIKIDHEEIKPFKRLNHTTKELQSGYLFFLDISRFPSGSEYEIEISKIGGDKKIIIPFYKE